jgi:hypothetical protein
MRTGYCLSCGKESGVLLRNHHIDRFLGESPSVWASILRALDDGKSTPLEAILKLLIRSTEPIRYRVNYRGEKIPNDGISLHLDITISEDALRDGPRRGIARMVAAQMAKRVYRAIMEKP